MGSLNAQSSKAQRQGIIAILCVSLIGCAHLGWSKTDNSSIQSVNFAIDPMTIAALKQMSTETSAHTKIVQIKGKVGNRAPLLGKTAYELQDSTDSIWVLATDPIPNAGDEVVIQGKLLYQSILINGKEQGSAYIEQQQLQHMAGMKSEVGGLKAEG